MSNIEWTYKLAVGAGQAEDADGVLLDKTRKHTLSISVKGGQKQLQTLIANIAPIIAEAGGQETLDTFNLLEA